MIRDVLHQLSARLQIGRCYLHLQVGNQVLNFKRDLQGIQCSDIDQPHLQLCPVRLERQVVLTLLEVKPLDQELQHVLECDIGHEAGHDPGQVRLGIPEHEVLGGERHEKVKFAQVYFFFENLETWGVQAWAHYQAQF